MTRDEVEHILRAAGAITGHAEWVIVGSQAKDQEFVAALLRHGITTMNEIEERLPELDETMASRIRTRLRSALWT